ncbi:ankyrin repeat and SOCS box protein 4 isoform X2 [Brienomyrus brachyistius]|uniref:ankyrin repeat and SOCS box protein 4 isoform X2 n=1 Tax=Brienomyrus brachyistius TaxID=42636 RepID=UPI0020B40260|nr:ankyrin repeat and SOCS box protein 4 isoform X2 [Brienomyrus brachyistius]
MPSGAQRVQMIKPDSREEAERKLKARFLQALQCDDVDEVHRILHNTNIDIDGVFDVEDRSMILASYKQGYWLPGYKLESSWATGLHVCVMYNSLASGLALLGKGAAINRKPNGKTPLHVACEVSNSDFVTLLLSHGARINSISLSGHTALHYCITKESVDCAKQLILKGAMVDCCSENSEAERPLHTAARFGIPELVGLYLTHGANVNATNVYKETPLITATYWALHMRDQVYSGQHHLVCRMLLDHGADVNAQEVDDKVALHKAAWNCDHVLTRMLLEAGANARIMDINGCSPIQYLLKVTSVRPGGIPELCTQLLLNHGAVRIYPPQFHKVLQSCHEYPRMVEVIVNSYEHIKSTRKWKTAIPDNTYKRHQDFYDSLFAVCSDRPRTLQHLARCAIRARLGSRCHAGVRSLPMPLSMQRYLLLEPEGIIY